MYSRRAGFILLLLVVVAFVLSGFFHSRLPELVATHWNARGEVDNYMSPFWGAFGMPLLLAFLLIVFSVVPRLHPLKVRTPDPNGRIDAFLVGLFLFFLLLHIQMLLWNTGTKIPFNVTVPVGIGAIFFLIGMMLGSVEPNWIVGIRTYWTLKSPVVWARTHERASILFRILGLICAAAAFFRDYILFFILLPAIFVALYLVAYSFLLYQKLEK